MMNLMFGKSQVIVPQFRNRNFESFVSSLPVSKSIFGEFKVIYGFGKHRVNWLSASVGLSSSGARISAFYANRLVDREKFLSDFYFKRMRRRTVGRELFSIISKSRDASSNYSSFKLSPKVLKNSKKPAKGKGAKKK